MNLRSAGLSHEGYVRTNNEDAYLVRADIGLYVVCDGMGGHDGGEIASRMAIDAVERCVVDAVAVDGHWSLEAASAALRRGVEEAQDEIVTTSARLGFERPMGTTLVAAVLLEDVAVIASVGDSRAYLMVDGRFFRVTRDHTLANQYAELGLIPRSSVRAHPFRNVLARVVGSPAGVEPEFWEIPLAPGARLLLCTDGLSEMLEDEEAMRLLNEAPDPEAAAHALVAAALDAGGRDNVTVLVVERAAESVPAAMRCA